MSRALMMILYTRIRTTLGQRQQHPTLEHDMVDTIQYALDIQTEYRAPMILWCRVSAGVKVDKSGDG